MISEVLSKSAQEIQGHLDNPTNGMYTGDLRTRIMSVVEQMNEIRIELDAPPPRPKLQVHHVGSVKYENELKDALAFSSGGVHVYDITHELLVLFDYETDEKADDGFSDDGPWLVCDVKLSTERLKNEIRGYLPDANCFEVTRQEVIEKLHEMEDATRVALKEALDRGGKLHLVPMNLKRKHEPDGGSTVVLSDKDFALLISDEDVHTSVGEVPADATPATT